MSNYKCKWLIIIKNDTGTNFKVIPYTVIVPHNRFDILMLIRIHIILILTILLNNVKCEKNFLIKIFEIVQGCKIITNNP